MGGGEGGGGGSAGGEKVGIRAEPVTEDDETGEVVDSFRKGFAFPLVKEAEDFGELLEELGSEGDGPVCGGAFDAGDFCVAAAAVATVVSAEGGGPALVFLVEEALVEIVLADFCVVAFEAVEKEVGEVRPMGRFLLEAGGDLSDIM